MRAALLLLALAPFASAQVTEAPFGKMPNGKAVTLYTLKNKNGMTAKVMTYGAILTELHVPDKNGKYDDVVMGFDTLDGYLKGHPYFGANVGRCANRIANGEFKLDDKTYKLTRKDGDKHHLHGGKEGFDKKLWAAEIETESTNPSVTFRYTSPDGEEGYPGELKVSLTYTLTADNQLKLHFEAESDAPTVCGLAHHSYFNLAGHGAGDILKHKLQVNAEKYTPADETLIPTGKIEPVKDDDGPVQVAVVTEPVSGRKMEILTTEPGLQFYTGNFLDGKLVGKGGAVYKQHGAFCLEPQYFPDAINKLGKDGWYSPVIRPGDFYYQDTVFKFSALK
jgi:aldose 1-epimerase